MKYHAPKINAKFDQCGVTPEMYCVPWFLTFFAKIMPNVENVLSFWDSVAKKSDTAQVFYFAVALIINNQEQILNKVDFELPEFMVSISIRNDKELNRV